MEKAIELAKLSAAEGEVPVGAVIVKDDEIVSTGRNRREHGKNALYHAEFTVFINKKSCLTGIWLF